MEWGRRGDLISYEDEDDDVNDDDEACVIDVEGEAYMQASKQAGGRRRTIDPLFNLRRERFRGLTCGGLIEI